MKMNPDKKQWLPIYGAYKAIKDDQEGQPSIIETNYWTSPMYHSIVSITPILATGLTTLILATKGLMKLIN